MYVQIHNYKETGHFLAICNTCVLIYPETLLFVYIWGKKDSLLSSKLRWNSVVVYSSMQQQQHQGQGQGQGYLRSPSGGSGGGPRLRRFARVR
jgi:hypothetical protein